MNRILFYIFVALTLLQGFNAIAQENTKEGKKFDMEAFESKKGAFLTAEMGLTPEEAAAFIPLCNELQRKKFELGQECRDKTRAVRKLQKAGSSVPEINYSTAISACLEVRVKEAETEKEYYEKFLKILTPEKLYKYRDAEMRFGKMFMKEHAKK